MLSLRSVSRSFGGVDAVRGVSLEVGVGEVWGLIGPNGAGKTTLINLISGLLALSSGEMRLDGEPLGGLGAHRRARLGIARTFQNLRVFSSLSVAQNVEVARVGGARGNARLIDGAMERFGLAALRDVRAGALSYGHLRRLEIVRALALGPKLLMLDEPAAGMNEEETGDLAGSLRWVREHVDCAILVIDHDLKFILSLCERIAVMNTGRLIAEGAPAEITKNQNVIEAYLGEDRAEAADVAATTTT